MRTRLKAEVVAKSTFSSDEWVDVKHPENNKTISFEWLADSSSAVNWEDLQTGDVIDFVYDEQRMRLLWFLVSRKIRHVFAFNDVKEAAIQSQLAKIEAGYEFPLIEKLLHDHDIFEIDYKRSVSQRGSIENIIKSVYEILHMSENFVELLDTDFLNSGDKVRVPFLIAIFQSGVWAWSKTIVGIMIEPVDNLNANVHVTGTFRGAKKEPAQETVTKIIEKIYSLNTI